ncbi:FAD:protein FMN transferase [Lewinella sp. IMCC34183]|uniref:FAD:protein FMN transferase n=1 Tax=Lewinella sp. IMCC34183 TaxID=2248762 RepID=UPI001300AEE1|nr:FAD:protein FMN transferase [Lewinella sp. IMCC34183]
MRITLVALLLVCAPFLVAQHRVTVERAAMGTPWAMTVYALDTAAARRAIDSAYARVEQIEQSMSDYRADSEINRLARLPPRRFYPVSADLYRVLRFSRTLARRSRGAFDPTVGPLTKVWRRAFRQQRFPGKETVRAARARVQWQCLRLGRGDRVWLGRDSMQLDLGGVAKGYALDAAAAVLVEAGLPRFLIDGGGDLLLGDPPPQRAGWRIRVPAGPVDTSRVAVATSGSRFRYLEHDGQRYSHLIDPRTGYGLTDPREVTVVAPTAMVADALASAASVIGEGKKRRVAALFRSARVYWFLPER